MTEIEVLENYYANIKKDFLSPLKENNTYVTKFDQNYAIKNIDSLFSGHHPVLSKGVPRPMPYDIKNGWALNGINGIILDIEANIKNIKTSGYVSDTDATKDKIACYVHGNATVCALQNKYRTKTKEETQKYNSGILYEKYISLSQIDERAVKKIYPDEAVLMNGHNSFLKDNKINFMQNKKELGGDIHSKINNEANNTLTPKLTKSIYLYMLCQRTGSEYKPLFNKEELLRETALAIKNNPKEVYSVFQKASYYADISATIVCSKDKSVIQGKTREATYFSENIREEKVHERKLELTNTRSHSR